MRLESDEATAVLAAAAELAAMGDETTAANASHLLVSELPIRLRSLFEQFRLYEEFGAILVTGLGLDDESAGPTPRALINGDHGLSLHDALLLLLGAAVGDAFGWAAERDGRLVHDLLPIAGHELEASGISSGVDLGWHCDSAFHELRPDYVALLCVRNRDDIPTRVSVPDLTRLPVRTREILRSPIFSILPEAAQTATAEDGASASDHSPDLVPLLSGEASAPLLRFDADYIDLSVLDEESAEAYRHLSALVDESALNLVLHPGELLLVDNCRAVHGRGKFEARFDGTDRWLKRAYLTRDLRRSSAARASAGSRIIL